MRLIERDVRMWKNIKYCLEFWMSILFSLSLCMFYLLRDMFLTFSTRCINQWSRKYCETS